MKTYRPNNMSLVVIRVVMNPPWLSVLVDVEGWPMSYGGSYNGHVLC